MLIAVSVWRAIVEKDRESNNLRVVVFGMMWLRPKVGQA